MKYLRIFSAYSVFSFILTCCLVCASYAADTRVKVTLSEGGATVRVHFPRPLVFAEQRSDLGLVLKFSQGLGPLDFTAARGKLKPWAESLWASYDSILVKPLPGVTVRAAQEGQVLSLSFARKNTPKPRTAVTSSAPDNLALERAQAMLDMESGKVFAARESLLSLQARAPQDVGLKLDLARVEEKLQRWRQALRLYDQGLAMQPQSTPIAAARARLLRDHGTQLSAGADYLLVGDHSRQWVLNMFRGQRLLRDETVLAVDYARIDADESIDIRRVDGELAPFDIQRHRLTLQVSAAFKQGEQQFAAFAGAKRLGLGWGYQQASKFGVSGLDIEWQRPWFESPEALVNYGYRSRLALGHSNSFRQNLSLFGELSVNRFGLEGMSKAAQSSRVQGGVRYNFQFKGESVSAGYSLDYEDVKVESRRQNIFSQPYTPLPLLDREQHVVDLGWHKKLKPRLNFDAQVGLEFDRRNQYRAPFTRFLLVARPKPNLEWQASLQSGLSAYRGVNETFMRAGAQGTWFF